MNFNSRFLCEGEDCKRGKSGYRKDRSGKVYPHLSWTCFCNGAYHFLNFAPRTGNEPVPFCQNVRCRAKVGAWHLVYGHNTGGSRDAGSNPVYLGIHNGEMRYEGTYERESQTLNFTG